MAYAHLLYGAIVYSLCEVINRLLYKVYSFLMDIYSSMEERSILNFMSRNLGRRRFDSCKISFCNKQFHLLFFSITLAL